MTAKQIEKEVQRQAVLFEEQCAKGLVVDSKEKGSKILILLPLKKSFIIYFYLLNKSLWEPVRARVNTRISSSK